jgi:hypothetical protein
LDSGAIVLDCKKRNKIYGHAGLGPIAHGSRNLGDGGVSPEVPVAFSSGLQSDENALGNLGSNN